MNRLDQIAGATATVLLLLASSGVAAAAGPLTFVGISGTPAVPVELHVPGKAFGTRSGIGGETSFQISAPAEVTLWRLSDCFLLLRTMVEPGSETLITLHRDGSATARRVSDMDAAGMGGRHAAICPDLPATSTMVIPTRSGSPTVAAPTLALAIALVIGLVTGSRRFGTARARP